MVSDPTLALARTLLNIFTAWADSREKKKKAKKEKKEAEAKALAKASSLDESNLEVSATKAPETRQAEERKH